MTDDTLIATNEMRAEWAQIAVNAFIAEVGGDFEDAISDLICDLCHLAVKNDMDPIAEISRALKHYMDERDYPPDGWAPDNLLPNVEIIMTRGDDA